MVFTCWVGRPESVEEVVVSTPPQTTQPLSQSSLRENKLKLEYIPQVLVHAFAPCLDYIPPQLSAIRKTSQQVGGNSWRALPGPCSCVLGSKIHQSQLSPASSDPEKNKIPVIAGRISPYTSAVVRASPAKRCVAGCWDFVKLLPAQNHLLLLK